MSVRFYKLRAILLIHIVRILAKILFVEVPPVVSAAAFIEKNSKILLMDYSYMKGFGLPGGVVGKGESLEEAVVREIKEETGLEASKVDYFGSFVSVELGVPFVSALFVVKGKGKLKQSEEGNLFWLDPKEAVGKMGYKNAEYGLQKYVKSLDKNK